MKWTHFIMSMIAIMFLNLLVAQVYADDHKPTTRTNLTHKSVPAHCPECQELADKYNKMADQYNERNRQIQNVHQAIDIDKKKIAEAKPDANIKSTQDDLDRFEKKADQLEDKQNEFYREVFGVGEELESCISNCREKSGENVKYVYPEFEIPEGPDTLIHYTHIDTKCAACRNIVDRYNSSADKFNEITKQIQNVRRGQLEAAREINIERKFQAPLSVGKISAENNAKLIASKDKEKKLIEKVNRYQNMVEMLGYKRGRVGEDLKKLEQELKDCEKDCKKISYQPYNPQLEHHYNPSSGSEPQHANTYSPQSGSQLVYQPQMPHYFVTLGLKYLQYSNNGTEFAYSLNSTSHTFTNTDFNVHQNYHVGYDLGLGYLLPYKGSSVKLDYSYFNSSSSKTVTERNLFVEGTNVLSATGKTDFTTSLLNLTLRQLFPVSSLIDLSLYAGVNYTYLAKDMRVAALTQILNRITIQSGTSFRGIGPTFGIDAVVHPFINIYPSIGLVGDFQVFFPYGKLSTYSREYEGDNTSIESIPSETVMVPGAKPKVGINYDLKGNGQYVLECGYEAYVSLDATRAGNYSGTSTKISYQGIYVNLDILDPIR